MLTSPGHSKIGFCKDNDLTNPAIGAMNLVRRLSNPDPAPLSKPTFKRDK